MTSTIDYLKKHYRPFIGGGVEAKPNERSFLFYSYGLNLKPLLIMAKIKTTFLNSDRSQHDSELETFVNTNGEIYIQIANPGDEYDYRWVCLDVSTAIKLSKTLRTNINIAKEGINA